MNFMNDPAYQRAIQKIAALSPEDRAVLDTVQADEAFAADDMRKQISAMAAAADKSRSRRSLSLSNKRLDRNVGLANERLDYAKKQDATAEGLGWANIGLSGVTGAADLHGKRKRAKQFDELIGLYTGD